MPVFGVFGDGEYRVQPIYVEDLAGLAVQQGARRENAVAHAIGPETFTYRELVETIGRLIGANRPILATPPEIGYLAGKLIGMATGDVMITREEIKGLMAGLLYVETPPTGWTRLTDWIRHRRRRWGACIPVSWPVAATASRPIGATEQRRGGAVEKRM